MSALWFLCKPILYSFLTIQPIALKIQKSAFLAAQLLKFKLGSIFFQSLWYFFWAAKQNSTEQQLTCCDCQNSLRIYLILLILLHCYKPKILLKYPLVIFITETEGVSMALRIPIKVLSYVGIWHQTLQFSHNSHIQSSLTRWAYVYLRAELVLTVQKSSHM